MTDEENIIEQHDQAGQGENLTPEETTTHDYEFGDDENAAASADEHTEDHHIPPSDTQPARSVLPIVAAAGGVILLGVVAWWQFGRSNTTPHFTNDMPPLAAPSHAVSAAQTAPDAGVAPPVSSSLPVAPKTGAAAVSAITPLTPDSAQAMPALAPASSAAPVAAANNALPPTPVAPVPVASVSPVVSPMPAAATTVPVGADGDQRIQALSARIDHVQQDLDQATAQLSQLNNLLASSAASASGSKALQDKIDHIEEQLAQLHSGSANPAPASVTATHRVSTSSKKSLAHHAALAKAKKKPPVEAAPHHWVLRSASPGHAWVAEDDSSAELKEISVGDSLAGIGRVTAIQDQDGSWVVRGTRGIIK